MYTSLFDHLFDIISFKDPIQQKLAHFFPYAALNYFDAIFQKVAEMGTFCHFGILLQLALSSFILLITSGSTDNSMLIMLSTKYFQDTNLYLSYLCHSGTLFTGQTTERSSIRVTACISSIYSEKMFFHVSDLSSAGLKHHGSFHCFQEMSNTGG